VDRKAVCLVSVVLIAWGFAGVGRLAATGQDATAGPAEAVGSPATGDHPQLAFDPQELERRLVAKGMALGKPILIRIFKLEAQLEVWMDTGAQFELFATYPICNWSGALGPKLSEGDKQSPEGLYSIGPRQLRRIGRWPRSLDIGYPNTFDRGLGRTGSYVLVHGGCTTTGCFAMTNPVIAEIFRLSEAALAQGQERIQVHAFPFRMTPENVAAHASSEWSGFWSNLKEAYDLFERSRMPPAVTVCNKRYVVGDSAAGDGGDCVANVSGSQIGLARWRSVAKNRRARLMQRGRNVRLAYAAARVSRRAAFARQRQALHTGSARHHRMQR
jgi:murein L,D-transpeptidase YafK